MNMPQLIYSPPVGNCQVSRVTAPFCFPHAAYENLAALYCQQYLVSLELCATSYCIIIFNCGLNLHFTNEQRVGYLLMCLFCYILFDIVSAQPSAISLGF